MSDLNVDTTSPGGGMVLDMMAALASFEARMIGSRVKAGNVEKIQQGRALGGPVPFHLRIVAREGGGTVRVVDESKAPVAKEIVERLLAGSSFRSIALDLNRRGVAAPRHGVVVGDREADRDQPCPRGDESEARRRRPWGRRAPGGRPCDGAGRRADVRQADGGCQRARYVLQASRRGE